MRVLIIGSKGFNCYSFLKKNENYEVYGADVVVEYNDPNYFLIDPGNSNFGQIFRQQQFDWCINCSGAASVSDSFKNPGRDYLLNVHHVVQLLNAIKEENVNCKFIQLSSAAVYGNPQVLPIKENLTLMPLSPYGIHKKQAEELCKLYTDYFGIQTYIVRIFSAYGSGLKKQLFWDLYKKSQAQRDMILFGTGKETRDFIHVEDVVRAIEVIMNTVQTNHLVINIGNGESITIKKAVIIFLQAVEFKGKFSFSGETRIGDPLYWQAETSVLNSLGYTQQITFEQGIKNYCEWLEEKE